MFYLFICLRIYLFTFSFLRFFSAHFPRVRRAIRFVRKTKPDSGENEEIPKSPEEIAAAFTAAGVDVNRPVIATCGSGVTASVLALALECLGAQAAVYDGSWAQWGGASGGDVVTGDA